MKSILCFYFDQLKSIDIAIPIIHFRVAEIPFYIENPRRFSNSLNGDYKLESHGEIDRYADILIRTFHEERASSI